jgi:hypothetical protein
MTDPGQLADNLETARAPFETLWRQVQGRGLYDMGDWRQALATIEELAAVAARVDSEIASQLCEALGWFAAGDDGSPPLPEDFAGGMQRICEVADALRALGEA